MQKLLKSAKIFILLYIQLLFSYFIKYLYIPSFYFFYYLMETTNLSYKDFQIVKDLGSGSFGRVQLVRKKTDQKLYAIKSVNMTRLNQKQKNSALNEVRLLASINVPYVISYKGSFFNNQDQNLCVVMEYADGGDLEGKINARFKSHSGTGFEQTFVWKVAFQIFQGLKILHKNNIIHRDIKSANIFFVDDIAKLGDLNVSKVLENGMCSTQTGTPYYTSPEIWKGKKYGKKCDIWSTGCLLYELCTLHPPFRAKDFPGLYKKVIVGNYDPISSNYSQELQQLIRMCLTVDQDMRPSAIQLLQTTILSGMELSLQKFRHQDESITLIDPIKCPRVLRFLNNKLPQAKSENKGKKTVGFVTKKEIEGEKGTNNATQLKLKRAKSEKVIIFGQQTEHEIQQQKIDSTPKLVSKNRIELPPIQKHPDEPLKFSVKKVKIGESRNGLVGSRKVIRLPEKENNSMKLIES